MFESSIREIADLKKKLKKIADYIDIADLGLFSDQRLVPLIRNTFGAHSYGPIMMTEKQLRDAGLVGALYNYTQRFDDCVDLIRETSVYNQLIAAGAKLFGEYDPDMAAIRRGETVSFENMSLDDDDDLDKDDDDDDDDQNAVYDNTDEEREAHIINARHFAGILTERGDIAPEECEEHIQSALSYRIDDRMLGTTDEELLATSISNEDSMMTLYNSLARHTLERVEDDLAFLKAGQRFKKLRPLAQERGEVIEGIRFRHNSAAQLIERNVIRTECLNAILVHAEPAAVLRMMN